ncbi:MAG: bacillithiol biosynthesis deacetylase BshB1 [Saprospiraceae bacterium]|nr:bacillithiol biosynthesis deacetylase BshB1 [Saprospiraceae bacterium]
MADMIQPVDILAIGVHPDDVELSCSGTLLKHKAAGMRFGILDLTLGELGTRGNSAIRKEEAMKAAELMGAVFRIQLDLGDGFFNYSEQSIRAIIPVIRAARPALVLANALEDRHPDHGRAAKLTADACFYAGLRKITSVWEGQEQAAHRPRAVYHYSQDYYLPPDLIVDISDFMDAKLEAIRCFKSQFYDPQSKEPESPISGKEFIDEVTAKCRVAGRSVGVRFGEAFNVKRPPGIQLLTDLL